MQGAESKGEWVKQRESSEVLHFFTSEAFEKLFKPADSLELTSVQAADWLLKPVTFSTFKTNHWHMTNWVTATPSACLSSNRCNFSLQHFEYGSFSSQIFALNLAEADSFFCWYQMTFWEHWFAPVLRSCSPKTITNWAMISRLPSFLDTGLACWPECSFCCTRLSKNKYVWCLCCCVQQVFEASAL